MRALEGEWLLLRRARINADAQQPVHRSYRVGVP